MLDAGRSTSTHAVRRIDPAGLTGVWVNTESSPRGVVRVVIERRPDSLGIWALGADDPTEEGWGWTDAEDLYAASPSGDEAVAFTMAYHVDPMPVAFTPTSAKACSSSRVSRRVSTPGIPMRGSHGSSSTGPARRRTSRSRRPGKQPQPDPSQPRLRHRPSPESGGIRTPSGPASTRSRSGHGAWLGNADSWADDSGLHDWGTTTVEIYNEVGTASEPAKIKARYDLGLLDVLLHGWVKQGVLVLALFRRFKDESAGRITLIVSSFTGWIDPENPRVTPMDFVRLTPEQRLAMDAGWLSRGPRGT